MPSSVVRGIRTLDELGQFKSSELQNYLFFYSFFIFRDVLPAKIYNHFMLLSASMFKVYSRHSTLGDVDDAREEVDKFLEGIDHCKYTSKYKLYNVHMLPHVVEDRVRFGALSGINAYSYENDLQIDKKDSSSSNARVETFATRALLRSILNFKTFKDRQCEIFKPTNLVRTEIHPKLVRFLQERFNVNKNYFIFYSKAKNRGNYFSSIIYSDSHRDCFVRVGQDFHLILLIFHFRNQNFVLLKKIKVSEESECQFQNFKFRMNQIKVVDDSFSKDKTILQEDFQPDEHCVMDFSMLRSHCMYYEQSERVDELTNRTVIKKYLSDMEH